MYGDVHALIRFATSLMQTAAAEVAAAAAAAVAAELLTGVPEVYKCPHPQI